MVIPWRWSHKDWPIANCHLHYFPFSCACVVRSGLSEISFVIRSMAGLWVDGFKVYSWISSPLSIGKRPAWTTSSWFLLRWSQGWVWSLHQEKIWKNGDWTKECGWIPTRKRNSTRFPRHQHAEYLQKLILEMLSMVIGPLGATWRQLLCEPWRSGGFGRSTLVSMTCVGTFSGDKTSPEKWKLLSTKQYRSISFNLSNDLCPPCWLLKILDNLRQLIRHAKT